MGARSFLIAVVDTWHQIYRNPWIGGLMTPAITTPSGSFPYTSESLTLCSKNGGLNTCQWDRPICPRTSRICSNGLSPTRGNFVSSNIQSTSSKCRERTTRHGSEQSTLKLESVRVDFIRNMEFLVITFARPFCFWEDSTRLYRSRTPTRCAQADIQRNDDPRWPEQSTKRRIEAARWNKKARSSQRKENPIVRRTKAKKNSHMSYVWMHGT